MKVVHRLNVRVAIIRDDVWLDRSQEGVNVLLIRVRAVQCLGATRVPRTVDIPKQIYEAQRSGVRRSDFSNRLGKLNK